MFTAAHRSTPAEVGMRMAAAVHFRLPVSLRMVRQVVEQGQWNRQKIIRHSGVTPVHPWEANRALRLAVLSISASVPV